MFSFQKPKPLTWEIAFEMLNPIDTWQQPDVKGFNRAITQWRKEHKNELFKFHNVDLRGKDLTGIDFKSVDLTGSDLSEETNLANSLVKGAVFQNVDLRNSVLTEIKDIKDAKWDGAIYSDGTQFPKGFKPEQYGMVKKKSLVTDLGPSVKKATPIEPQNSKAQIQVFVDDENISIAPNLSEQLPAPPTDNGPYNYADLGITVTDVVSPAIHIEPKNKAK